MSLVFKIHMPPAVSPAAPAVKVITGNAHPELAELIAKRLGTRLARVLVIKQANGETAATIGESMREEDVYVIQPGSGNADATATHINGINDNFMELLIIIHACRAASARKITAVVPCFPYARQDKKDRPRAPITAKLMAKMLTTAGANHVITMDLHAAQAQGFFSVPTDNLIAEPSLLRYITTQIDRWQDAVVVSPDAGGAKRCTSIADRLGLGFAVIHKERLRPNEVARMTLVGDVAGRPALLVDDLADTCGTLCAAATTLLEHGATSIYALVVHPILSGSAVERIAASPITRLVVTNTLPLSAEAKASPKIDVIDISATLAEAIRRANSGESISFLFANTPDQ